ncbi:MAG: tRNA nucleotidyltransferase (CCA-adding enzyme), partial [Francisellaceae bacterium]
NRLKIPNKYRHLAVKVTQYHLHCHTAFQLRSKTIMALINNLDGLRNPETFENYIIVCEADAKGRKGFENNSYPQADYLRECLQCCQSINTKALVDQGLKGKNLGDAIQEKQVNAISNIKEKWNF